jgi:hypothetical protein
MTVTLDIPKEIEAGLVAQARTRGLTLEAYLQQMIQAQGRAMDTSALSAEEWVHELEAWVESFPNTPVLSDEAISRASMYPDRW